MKLKKAKWEAHVDMLIEAKLREARRLVAEAIKKPDISLCKLASIELNDTRSMMTMRRASEHIAEGEYAFTVDKFGFPEVMHAPMPVKNGSRQRNCEGRWGETPELSHLNIDCEDDTEG